MEGPVCIGYLDVTTPKNNGYIAKKRLVYFSMEIIILSFTEIFIMTTEIIITPIGSRT